MSDQDIEIQEAVERLRAATDAFLCVAAITTMRYALIHNTLFNFRAYPYQLGAITQTLTGKQIVYANDAPICWN
jgi:hypothetical protein